MRLRKAVLFGLAIGFAVGGRVPHWAKAAPFDTSEEQSTSRGPGVALPHPAPLPAVVYPDLLPQDAIRAPRLPTIVTPSAPGKTGKAGTGFFIASDGTLLTAAHVVTGCARTEVVSPYVKPTKVQLLATDQRQDIALLRAFHLRPPAILALGGPASRRMFVLGYPASAGPIIPAETWATLENDKFPRPVLGLSDPRETIWIEAVTVAVQSSTRTRVPSWASCAAWWTRAACHSCGGCRRPGCRLDQARDGSPPSCATSCRASTPPHHWIPATPRWTTRDAQRCM